MKNVSAKSIHIGLAAFVLAFLACQSAFATSATQSHNVTIIKPKIISITADKTDFDLEFADFISGTNSDTEVVTYTLKANAMTATGKMSGKLDALFTGVDFKATVGSYTDALGGAHSVMTPVSGTQTIGTSDVNLATPSAAGKIRGTLPVTYSATATAELDDVDQTKQLTVTFADA